MNMQGNYKAEENSIDRYEKLMITKYEIIIY